MRQELDFNRPVTTPHEIRDLLRAVRITSENGTFYAEREKKYHEVVAFATHLLVLEREMCRDRELVLVDGGCGKSYLSFVLNHILTHKVGRPVRFIGVDSQPGVIQTCREVAGDLGFNNMAFHQGRALDLGLEGAPDLVYALHACDTATDEVIALAIRSRAMAVAVAPCCHREVQRTLGPQHPMSDVGRFHVFRERFSAMLTDTVRASALEAAGYGVKVIEFVAARHTPKNILLRARRRSYKPNPRALAAYRRLQVTYGFRSSLETYLPELFKESPEAPVLIHEPISDP